MQHFSNQYQLPVSKGTQVLISAGGVLSVSFHKATDFPNVSAKKLHNQVIHVLVV
jgi:hypothetical protein